MGQSLDAWRARGYELPIMSAVRIDRVSSFSSLIIAALLIAAVIAPAAAGDAQTPLPDGVVTWSAAMPGAQLAGEYAASRWGMYEVQAQLSAAAAGSVTLAIAGKELTGTAEGTAASLGRVYFAKDGAFPFTVRTAPADAKAPLAVAGLRFTPAPEGGPIVQADDQSITLHAHDATVHGTVLRYEARPEKNTLGYWANEQDWVSWEFELRKPGTFIVVAMQGSHGGSELDLAIGDQKLHWTTADTGSFHTFTFLEVGRVSFAAPGMLTLSLKPTKKNGGAVMDLRQVILLPVLK